MKTQVKLYDLYWSPEGRCIATVEAKDFKIARRKTPKPYRRFLGEIYVTEVVDNKAKCNVWHEDCPRHGKGVH